MDDLTLTKMVSDRFVQAGIAAVVGTAVTFVLLRRYPAGRLAIQAAFVFALTFLLLYHGIVPYEVAPSGTPAFERVFVAAAKVIWWVNVAWVLTAAVRVFLTFERRPREARLIQDLLVGVIYLGATLSVVAYVFSAPIGTLIATSGVLAVILGLAMQSTLSDLFSGIALNLSRPYSVGDWIVLADDGSQGRVVETNWRATHLLNATNDLVVLPNSGLAKSRFTNLSSPSRSHGVTLSVRMAPTMMPSAIAEVMQTVLLSCTSISATPAPSVQIKSLDALAIELELSFRVRDFATAAAAKHQVYDLIYRHVKATGLTLAQPLAAPIVTVGQARATLSDRSTALRLLDAIPLFRSLTEEEKEALASTMTRHVYAKGEIIVEQGATLTSLMVIRSGVAVVSRREQERDVEFSRLAPGDYFGESGLFTGAGEMGTVQALTPVVAYEVGQADLANLMQERPSIADEISVTLSRRSKLGQEPVTDHEKALDLGSVPRLVARIRQLFGVTKS